MTELSPCPFCGGTNLNYESRNAIHCEDCTGAVCLEDMPLTLTAREADRCVVGAWNRRPKTIGRGLEQTVLAMWDEYMRDEECDYTKINALIEKAYAEVSAPGVEGKQGLTASQSQPCADASALAAGAQTSGKEG